MYQPSSNDLRRPLRLVQVAQHPVGALHQQHAFLARRKRLHAFRDPRCARPLPESAAPRFRASFRFEISLPSRKSGRVHRHHRRHFGHAVAFQQIDAEGFLEFLAQRLAQFFRAHHHEAQRRELFPRALAHIRSAERGRGKQERAFVFVNQFADDFRVGRIGMIDHSSAGEQRQPDGGHEAERVKQRQHSDDAVALVEREELQHGVDVGRQVEVREHDAFRHSGAAARKDHRGQAVGIALGRQPGSRAPSALSPAPQSFCALLSDARISSR